MRTTHSYLRFTAFAAIGTAAIAMTACNVEQTREGSLPDVDVEADAGNLPEYEVRQQQAARAPDLDIDVDYHEGQLPKYDVEKTEEGRLPNVDVSARGGSLPEFEVEGPDIRVERKTVEVPVLDVDVDMPDDDEAVEEEGS